MLCKENGGGSVLVVDREVSSYGVYVAVAGRQPLSPSTPTNRQQRTEEIAAVADSSNGCNSVGSSSSTGRSLRRMMGSPGGLFDGRRSRGGGRSNSSVTLEALESVVMRVIDRVREYGYGEDVCSDLQEHFAYLSSRYTLNIDPERHEDVLLHMRLLQAARKAAEEAGGSRGSSILLDEQTSSFSAGPFINVRKVQLWSAVDMSVMMSGRNSPLQNNGTGSGCWGLKIPKPAFGSCSNLASLGCGASPKVHPSSGGGSLTRLAFGNWGTTPPLQPTPLGSTDCACSRPAFGSFTNPLHMDEDGAGYNSDNEDAGPTYGYEITLATSDRHGLLRHYTTAISNIKTELNIKEAHVFSTTDGMALEVFVVEGWDGDDADELRWAVLLALDVKEEWLPKYIDAKLKAAAESIQYEDWAVDYNLLVIGEKLGKGSSGQLYRGKYMSQDVAIKMIALDNDHDMGTQGADSLRAFPASELLHTFKQEVSIMRLVRHKNLVQFIGACSCWPRLCIVTELMSGGSVRDVLEFQMGGLDIPSAVKVLRDAARGMDFLHKRGVVHRDLKAANLLIDEHDVVKVCDFGVARLKPTTVSSSGKGRWTAEMTAETGTYRWMSPEVLEHKPYDHKADVYSFGITMWEVLTGEIPYAGFTPLQAAIGVVQRGLRPEMPPFIPEKLRLLVQQCWHQDPKQRPEFSEVLAVLEEMTVRTPYRRFIFVGRKARATFHA